MRPVAAVPSSLPTVPGVQYFSVELELPESGEFDNALDWASISHTLEIDSTGKSALGPDDIRYVSEGSVLTLHALHEQYGEASSTFTVAGPGYNEVRREVKSTADDIEVNGVGEKTVYGELLQLGDSGAVGLRFDVRNLPLEQAIHNVWLTFAGMPEGEWRYQVRVPSTDESLVESLDALWPDSEPLEFYQTRSGNFSSGYLQQLAHTLKSATGHIDIRLTGQGQLLSSETQNKPSLQAYFSATDASQASSSNEGVGENAGVIDGDAASASASASDSDSVKLSSLPSEIVSLPANRRTARSVSGSTTHSTQIISPHDPMPPSDISFGEIAGQFSVNALGGGNYTVPIVLPSAPGGLTPELSLNYSTSAGEGLAGTGWSLNGLSSIRRCAKSYAKDNQRVRVQHNSDDAFCLNGQRLVHEGGSLYRTANDQFKKIERVTTGGNDGWKVSNINGTEYTYGLSIYPDQTASNNGRIEGVDSNGNAGAVHVWALSSATDVNGNNFRAIYFEDGSTTQHYPIEFRYGDPTGTQVRVKFQYYNQHLHWPQYRNDTYANGFKFTNTRRLKVIQVERGDEIALHNYFFDYEINPEFARWTLKQLQFCKPQSCLPAKTFEWIDRGHGLVGPNQVAQSGVWAAPSTSKIKLITGDFNGDGRTDVIRPGKGTCFSQGNQFSCNNQSPYLTSMQTSAIVADYNGDGMDDYLVRDYEGEWRVCWSVLNNAPHQFACAITTDFGNGSELKVGDFDGDGRSDIYRVEPRGVFYGNAYAAFQYVEPTLDFNGSPAGSFKQELVMDVNGDGASDIVGLRQDTNQWVSCVEATGTILEHAVNTYSCQNETGNGLPVNGYSSGDDFDIQSGDFNADGRSDLIFYNRNDQRWYVYFSNGHENAARFTKVVAIDNGFGGDEDNHLVVDLNGDGRTDVIRWQDNDNYQVAYAAAGHFNVVDNVKYATLGSLPGPLSDELSTGDFDSDGRRDIARGVANQVGIHLSEAYSAPILSKVVSNRPEHPPQTTLKLNYSYTTVAPVKASVYPNRVTYNTHIVRSSEVPGNRPGEFDKTTYDYKELLVNKRGLGVLGFNIRAETDERRQLKRHYLYHDKYPLVGRINQVVTSTVPSGMKQQVKWYKYTVHGQNYTFTTDPEPTSSSYNAEPDLPVPDRYWVYMAEEKTHRYDYHTNTHVSTAIDNYTYTFDGNGKSRDYGKAHIHQRTTADHVNNRNWVETTTNVYQNRPTDYLMGLKIRSTVTLDSDGTESGPVVTKVRDYRYDTKGQVDKVIIEPDMGPSKRHEYLRTEYDYDDDGNVKEEKSFGNTFGYQALPARSTNTTTSYPLAGQQSVAGTTLVKAVKREVITNAEDQELTIE
ncbi:hypothetical protein AB833_03395, partial [Chromatiales bacterium (ex Bugula neritina AB1)]